MGVGIHSAIHFCKLAQKVRLGGDLLTLGVQDAVFDEEKLRSLALRHSLPDPPEDWEGEINERQPFKKKGFLNGASLWSFLGFSSVTTLDVSDYQDASVMLDLNKDHVPSELEGRFDVVFDGGTIEHIFHLPNTLKNLYRMTKVGGLIIHQAVSLPLIDHGFYMFSPTFFHDFYTANGFEIIDLQLVMYSADHPDEPCWFTDYTPGCLKWVSNRGYSFPGMNFLVLGCFKRLADSTGDVVPQQGAFVKNWKATMKRKQEAAASSNK